MEPLALAKLWTILDNVLVRCEENLEVVRAKLALQSTTLCRVAFVRDHPDRWGPLGEFSRPIGHGRQGGDDEVRTALAFDLNEEGDEGDGLDRFSKTLEGGQHIGAVEQRMEHTISSARMPLSLLLYKLTIHWRPLIWYSLRVPPTRMPGCLTVSLIRCAIA